MAALPSAPSLSSASLSSAVVSVVDSLVNPLADNQPVLPSTPPIELALLSYARRQGLYAPVENLDLGLGNPISVLPVVPQLTDGILGGQVIGSDTGGVPLTYHLIGDPSGGGKAKIDPDTGNFILLPDHSTVTSGGTEQFDVMVSQNTPVVAALTGLPTVGPVFSSIVVELHQVPILSTALTPVIGYAVVEKVTVDVGDLAPGQTPVGYTVKVISFDGTPISMNFFPAAGLAAGETAPTIFTGSGLSAPGNIDPYLMWDPSNKDLVPGPAALRALGNVVTWDSRGKAASGGILNLDSPFFEGRDVSAMIDYVTAQGQTTVVGGDPLIGMVGGSYGGGIQLVSASIDKRIDAIVPGIAWHTLNESLYPDDAFKTIWVNLLVATLVGKGARINPQIYSALVTGDLFGFISETGQTTLASSGPGFLVDQITAPTLLIQGGPDGLFPLDQAITNAEMINANGVPVKMIWYCGGHAVCLNPEYPIEEEIIMSSTLAWIRQYVNGDGTPADDIPTFQFVDQNGHYWESDRMPFESGFYGAPVTGTGDGGLLPIVPFLGGSGPSPQGTLPRSIILAGEAGNAVNVPITSPSATDDILIVGAPEVEFTYSGLGNSRYVYGQLVDKKTGRVLGNIVSPVPVTLDGGTHTVKVPLDYVAYNMAPDDELILQLTSSSITYENFTAYGVVTISDVKVSLPTVAPGVATAEPSFATELAPAS